MEWVSLNELRELFLKFFESKQHKVLPSFSLVPNDDNSLLLINSGMAPMKKYFTGEITPPSKRVATCQKCIRTPDIDSVGITARHGTFFEMLGCFSFGDYFKREIMRWAWEFCVDVLKLPKERLWISVYEEDDESIEIWTKEVGVDPSRIVKLGKSDNFWEHGKGPCGPCSELYFDRGEQYSCGAENCKVGCDCDRYIEFWNLVFTQFENDGNGNYSRLSRPNIDTGMGLERLACIMQNVDNIFLVDTVQKIIKKICTISNKKYGFDKKDDISIRIIADHMRSSTFMISDGVLPSNEGRGYVLKRLLRRAARQGKLLGISKPFLSEICQVVIEENACAYPVLKEKCEFIKKVVRVEEENFLRTIDQGLLILDELIKTANGERTVSGDDAFKLSDTYGFPIDLTKEILAEKGMKVDEERFKELLKEQKVRARNARKNAGADAWENTDAAGCDVEKTVFCGYESLTAESKVLVILKNGENVSRASAGDKVTLVLDKTPFYAESGGQIGDKGILHSTSVKIFVNNVHKNQNGIFFHDAEIVFGEISQNDIVRAEVDSNFRSAVTKNHTAAHLLQAALRKILGNHVEQAGQLVNEKEVRFDFTHFSAVQNGELAKVEEIVNEVILKDLPVIVKEMPIEEAKKLGAMALFGEKYGNIVRVVDVPGFSTELCGGTHVGNTSKLGLFKIISENSVASGVRRVVAITGLNVLNLLNAYCDNVRDTMKVLKVSSMSDLKNSCQQLLDSVKEKDRVIDKLEAQAAESKVAELLSLSETLNTTKIVVQKFNNVSVDWLKTMCDKIKNQSDNFIAVLATADENKATIVVALGDSAINKGLNAGKLVKEIAQLAGGNGGGKANFATAGIKNVAQLEFALGKVKEIVSKNL